jgi:hypothetical protein
MKKHNKKLPEQIVNDFKSSYLEKLARIAPLHLHSALTNREVTRTVHMPEVIDGRYYLVKDFQPEKPYPFKIGLYKDKKGTKFVGKIWRGRVKNLHYYNLINEIISTYVLSNARARLENKLGKDIANIYTPSFIELIQKDNCLIFISEFMEGKRFIKLSEKQRREIYKKFKKYLRFLGRNLSDEEKDLLRVRSGYNLVLQYPLLLTTALARRPYLAPMLFKGMKIFVKGIPNLLKSDDFTIVHGDVNYDNILISPKRISIIDVEQLMYTLSVYEDVATVSSARNTKEFSGWIIDNNLEMSFSDPAYALLYSTLLVNCETHNLTGNSSPPSLKNHIKRFNLGLKVYESVIEKRKKIKKNKFVRNHPDLIE